MKIQLANLLRLAERAKDGDWNPVITAIIDDNFRKTLDPGTVAALVEDNLRMAEAIEAHLPKPEHTATHDFDCPLKIHPKLREDGATCVCEPELRAALEKHREKFE